MPTSRTLLYLLPELCIVSELTPGKKPHSFALSSFRQINGDLMNDEDLVTENVVKLFSKLEAGTYTLVLPDFLFTNTIIDVAEMSEDGVRTYLLNKLLPSLGLSKDTHQLETFILAQHQGKTKVQLSGLEKSILAPVYDLALERDITIETICPLSWTLKSAISLEPSLSAIEVGEHIYLAQHYIGIDQSVFFPTNELSNIVETIRTLKGTEPNLQTLYLLTTPEVEQRIKEQLKQRIPLQQLAHSDTPVEGLPAHMKTALEAAGKTLDIEDYPVPRFVLEKYVESSDSAASHSVATEQVKEQEEHVISKPLSLDDPEESEMLPAPTPLETLPEPQEEFLPMPSTAPSLPVGSAAPVLPSAFELQEETLEDAPTDRESEQSEQKDTPTPQETTSFVERPNEHSTPDNVKDDVWVSDDAGVTSEESSAEVRSTEALTPFAPTAPTTQVEDDTIAPRPTRQVIKNRSNNGALLRMVGITLAALITTVGVGLGAGYVILQQSEQAAPVNNSIAIVASPTIQASPTATNSASPSASTAPTPSKATLKILVVNATTVSGFAGKTKAVLTAAGYTSVDTANAKAKYEPGNYLLLEKENPELAAQLGTDSTKTLTVKTPKSAEDAAGKYDAVIVLNQAD